MMKNIIKNKKGVSISMIAQSMVVIFSMFMIMSTFVVMNAIIDKSKRNSSNLKNFCNQLSEDFIYYNELHLNDLDYGSTPSQVLEIASVDFFTYYLTKDFSRQHDTSAEDGIFHMINTTKKYEIFINVDYENYTTKISLKRTFSATIYFNCEMSLNTSSHEFVIMNWFLKM